MHEWTTYLNNIAYRHGGAPMWLIGWGNTTWDADGTLIPMFRTGQLLANYWNPDFNALLDDAQTNMDPKKRLTMYSKASRFFLDDPPAIPLYQQIDNYGVNRKLNWTARPDERIEGLSMSLKP